MLKQMAKMQMSMTKGRGHAIDSQGDGAEKTPDDKPKGHETAAGLWAAKTSVR